MERIAWCGSPPYTRAGDWELQPQQSSAPLLLQAGRHYPILAVGVDRGTRYDNLAIKVTSEDPAVIQPGRFSSLSGRAAADADGAVVAQQLLLDAAQVSGLFCLHPSIQ